MSYAAEQRAADLEARELRNRARAERERRIIDAVVRTPGASHREIGNRLGYSVSQVQSVLRKFNTKREEA